MDGGAGCRAKPPWTSKSPTARRGRTCGGEGPAFIFLAGERDIRDTAQAPVGHLRSRRGSSSARRRRSCPCTAPLRGRTAPCSLRTPPPRGPGDECGRNFPWPRNHATLVFLAPGPALLQQNPSPAPPYRLLSVPARTKAGRCGRIAPGIRLYSMTIIEFRPHTSEPETSASSPPASRDLADGFTGPGRCGGFPFLDPFRRVLSATAC